MFPDGTDYVVADSSFYLCFLEDIQKPTILCDMLDHFDFIAGSMLHSEISKCQGYASIDGHKHLTILPSYNYGELLKPFFSKYQLSKGEAEVIGLAAVLHGIDKLQRFILDEHAARQFVHYNLERLAEVMCGTIGFIEKCCCEFKILSKTEALALLGDIEHSSFRVSHNLINEARQTIKDRDGAGH